MENNHKIIQTLERIERFLLKNSQISTQEIYDCEQAARYLLISKSTLYKYISDRKIVVNSPAGKLIRITKSELDRFLSSNKRRSIDDLNGENGVRA